VLYIHCFLYTSPKNLENILKASEQQQTTQLKSFEKSKANLTQSETFLAFCFPKQCRIQGSDWGDRPPKIYESNFIHHNFVQFGEEHSRYKSILSSIVLSQQCCEVYFISPTVSKPLWELTTEYYRNRPS